MKMLQISWDEVQFTSDFSPENQTKILVPLVANEEYS